MMSGVRLSFSFIDRDFEVIGDERHTEIWEAGDTDPLIYLHFGEATLRECEAAVSAYFRGRSLGERRGRAAIQNEFCKLMGVNRA